MGKCLRRHSVNEFGRYPINVRSSTKPTVKYSTIDITDAGAAAATTVLGDISTRGTGGGSFKC